MRVPGPARAFGDRPARAARRPGGPRPTAEVAEAPLEAARGFPKGGHVDRALAGQQGRRATSQLRPRLVQQPTGLGQFVLAGLSGPLGLATPGAPDRPTSAPTPRPGARTDRGLVLHPPPVPTQGRQLLVGVVDVLVLPTELSFGLLPLPLGGLQ